jgi:hypothetical protein
MKGVAAAKAAGKTGTNNLGIHLTGLLDNGTPLNHEQVREQVNDWAEDNLIGIGREAVMRQIVDELQRRLPARTMSAGGGTNT